MKNKLGKLTVWESYCSLDYILNQAGKGHSLVNGLNEQLNSDVVDRFLVGEISHKLGIDVSNHNGKSIDWRTIKRNDVFFGFAKATEGSTYVDKRFPINWKRMKKAGLICGAYHFFRPLEDAKQQAENFLTQVNNILEPGDLAPILEVEHYLGKVAQEWEKLSLNQRIESVRKWLEIVEQATGIKPIIYTSLVFWQEYMEDLQVFNQYPLWLSHYTKQKSNFIVNKWGGNGWTKWSCQRNWKKSR